MTDPVALKAALGAIVSMPGALGVRGPDRCVELLPCLGQARLEALFRRELMDKIRVLRTPPRWRFPHLAGPLHPEDRDFRLQRWRALADRLSRLAGLA